MHLGREKQKQKETQQDEMPDIAYLRRPSIRAASSHMNEPVSSWSPRPNTDLTKLLMEEGVATDEALLQLTLESGPLANPLDSLLTNESLLGRGVSGLLPLLPLLEFDPPWSQRRISSLVGFRYSG